MNRQNLEILANYLESGKLRAAFNMQTYSDAAHSLLTPDCGSVGCAVGHGPYAGISKDPEETWAEYTERAFDLDMNEFRWCFSGLWAQYDNTPEGAAARIRYLLKNGAPPDDFLACPPWARY